MALTKRKNKVLQEVVIQGYDHADGVAATFADKLFVCRQKMRVDYVEYVNPTGYAEDTTNYWKLGVKKNSTIMAEYSTQTSAQGTITGDAFTAIPLSATDANLVADVGDEISFYGTKVAAAANLPAGRVIIHGRYL